MAASLATQSMLGSSVVAARVTGIRKSGVYQFSSVKYLPGTLQRNVSLSVRCMAKNEQQKDQSTQPPKLPRISTKFSDVFAFSGPAPERINGRLAMIGFVAALAVELSKGQDVFAQLSDGGVAWFLGTSVLLSVASLVPLFKGVSVESKSDGFMTSDAELWNGRFAMMGLVALAVTEFVKGTGDEHEVPTRFGFQWEACDDWVCGCTGSGTISKGQDVFAQISDGGIAYFLGTSVLLSLALLVLLSKGVSVESKSDALVTSDAELMNGRLAVLGLVAFAFTEYVKGGTLV
ncbi:Early light-induced protein 1 [Citrus sinensis]|uniref:Early light-induced protein 1 n=1 Tax=Citrus sinensis TaxID=2711 RepID=A0ACB8I5X9_CITSI|nr:Early light-induced protein 1 [Citrus sinensis]